MLDNYFAILQDKKKPRFQENKHKLNKKIDEAFQILKNCELCERKCHVDRTNGKKGFCQLTNEMIVSSYFDHLGEEPFLVPSFTVFFWSCTFQCQFCQNWDISQRIKKGIVIDEKKLASIIDQHAYCKNVNFVGGDPVPQLPFILKTLTYVKANIPVVWNSNFYMSKKSMNLLKGIVDVYLSDFKYGNNKCAERLSKVSNYFSIIKRNHLLAFKDSELVIRHLVMPNHIECCSKPILRFIEENFKDKVIVNIMDQYRPEYKAKNYSDINRFVTDKEFKTVVNFAEKLNLKFIT